MMKLFGTKLRLRMRLQGKLVIMLLVRSVWIDCLLHWVIIILFLLPLSSLLRTCLSPSWRTTMLYLLHLLRLLKGTNQITPINFAPHVFKWALYLTCILTFIYSLIWSIYLTQHQVCFWIKCQQIQLRHHSYKNWVIFLNANKNYAYYNWHVKIISRFKNPLTLGTNEQPLELRRTSLVLYPLPTSPTNTHCPTTFSYSIKVEAKVYICFFINYYSFINLSLGYVLMQLIIYKFVIVTIFVYTIIVSGHILIFSAFYLVKRSFSSFSNRQWLMICLGWLIVVIIDHLLQNINRFLL